MVFVIFHTFHDSMIDDKASWIRNVSTFCLWCLRISKMIASPERTVVYKIVSRPGVRCKIFEKRKTIKTVCDFIARNHGHIFRRMCVRRSMESFDLVCPWEPPLELNPNSRCFQFFFQIFSKCIQNAYSNCFRDLRNSLWTWPSSFVLAVWRDPKSERLPKIFESQQWIKKNIYLSRLLGSRVTWSLPYNTCILKSWNMRTRFS